VNKKHSLTPKQELFCHEYLKDLNGTQAAIRAGYSPKTANEQAARLLASVSIYQTVDELKAKRNKRIEIEADDVLLELKRLGHADIRQIYDEAGCVKQPKDWPEEIARAISRIEATEEVVNVQGGFICADCGKESHRQFTGITKKVWFWDKPKALELMGKHKRLFTDKVEHSGNIKLEDLVLGRETKEEEKE